MEQLNDQIDRVLSLPPYSQSPEEREAQLLALLKAELEYGAQRHPGYENYLRALAGRLSVCRSRLRASVYSCRHPEGKSAACFHRPGRSQTDPDFQRYDLAIPKPHCPRCFDIATHDQGNRNYRPGLHRVTIAGPIWSSIRRITRRAGFDGRPSAAILGLQPFATDSDVLPPFRRQGAN